MTELEQYKKAYATLVGRVDTTITKLQESTVMLNPETMALTLAADALTKALNEVEEIFLTEETEDE